MNTIFKTTTIEHKDILSISRKFSFDATTNELTITLQLRKDKEYDPQIIVFTDGTQPYINSLLPLEEEIAGVPPVSAKIQRVDSAFLVLDNQEGLTGSGTRELVVGKGSPVEETVAFTLPATSLDQGNAPYILAVADGVTFKHTHVPDELVESVEVPEEPADTTMHGTIFSSTTMAPAVNEKPVEAPKSIGSSASTSEDEKGAEGVVETPAEEKKS